MISICRYTDEKKSEWNEFNRCGKNSLFMFDRNFMDYHRDRFHDHSLMFYEDGSLIALLPLCDEGDVLYSHKGLTYGGFLTGNKMTQHRMNDCFTALISYAGAEGYKKIIYKTVPHIFCSQASEEDRYALFCNGSKLIKVSASSYVCLENKIKTSRGHKGQISRAKREGVEIKLLSGCDDYYEFIALVNEVLQKRHQAKAVHTGPELKLLHDNFPKNIHLFAALYNEKMIAGSVVFEYEQVVHTQYLAANDEARRIGALDLTIDTVINRYTGTKKWLDFGISTEPSDNSLNHGLIHQKEEFGARTGVYEVWELPL